MGLYGTVSGVLVVEVNMEAVDGVDDGDRLHPGRLLGGHPPIGGAQQLHGQGFDDHLSQLLPDAAPHASAEGHVAEAALPRLVSLRSEAFRVEQVRALVHRGGLVRVTDAVHDAPPFWDLKSLEKNNMGYGKMVCFVFMMQDSNMYLLQNPGMDRNKHYYRLNSLPLNCVKVLISEPSFLTTLGLVLT